VTAPARPVKRSITLSGHRTSVSLEDAFWSALREIAEREGMTVSALAARIDADRSPGTGLATAIRLYVLAKLQADLLQADLRPAGPGGAAGSDTG
jgi:predicted DNA-binding ribbon-helix-helix protein